VGVVDDFDERLDLGSLGDLLLAHRLGHFQGVSSTRNQLNLQKEKEVWLTARYRQQWRGGKASLLFRRLAAG
jgi:hypothetical protein